MKLRKNWLLLIAGVVMSMWLVGCCPCKTGNVPVKTAKTTAVTTLNVDSDCSIGVTSVNVNRGDTVEFCNNNECVVNITFESLDLFGVATVSVDPGDCASFVVRTGAADGDYGLTLDCGSCDGGGGHTSPEIKVGGGGP